MNAVLRGHGIGQVLDIVPNHMAAEGPRNAWWWDVMKHGVNSRYARYFDIFWGDLASPARVLVPILGDDYGKVLRSGDLKLERQGSDVVVRYFDKTLPLSPESQASLLAEAGATRRDPRHEDLDPSWPSWRAIPTARRPAQKAALPPRVLAVRGDSSQLPMLLRHQPARCPAAGRRRGLRCHAAVLGWLADGTVDGIRVDPRRRSA
jgi:maltooligosyltrehalose synthase